MAGEGKITFVMLEQAFRSLTTNGAYGKGVARYRATALGMGEEIRATFAKIPSAFLEGLMEMGIGSAKDGMAGLLAATQGWVATARSGGAYLRAMIVAIRDAWNTGTLGTALGDGLRGAVMNALDFVPKMLVGAVTSFGAAMLAVLPAFGKQLKAEFMGALGGPKADHTAAIGDIASSAAKAFRIGYDATPDMNLGEGAIKKFKDAFTPSMARTLIPDFLAKALPLAALGPYAALMQGAAAAAPLGLGNDPGIPALTDKMPKFDTDRLSKIGLFVGAGGPQGEQHAKQTATHTKAIRKAAEEMSLTMKEISRYKGGKFIR